MGSKFYLKAKFLLIQICFLAAHMTTSALEIREALEIGIGIGIGVGGKGPSPSESPPCDCQPPAPPGPSDFQDTRLYVAYQVIQRFKQTITCDPNGVTATWTGSDICGGGSYSGFFCGNPPDNATALAVASVDFNGFGLCAPTVAGFLDRLPDLALFHANSNNFSGTVPDLSGHRYLYELDVSNNRMSGPFPAATLAGASSSRLVFLDLRFNLFSGAVPGAAFSLDLDVLFLNDNDFRQPLPADLGATAAAYLTLANNGFTGPIPRSIRNASDTLVEVLFLNNRLSGCLPYEAGLLGRATVFDAGGNQLTGPIPYSFGCLARVEQLNLAGNYLYGQLPELVCELGSLENLSLSDNYLTWVGPACRKLIQKGVADVRWNCIPGLPMQRPPAECAAFAAMKPDKYYCSHMASYYYIPCKLPCSSSSSENNNTGNGKVRPAPSPTYSALHRRRS